MRVLWLLASKRMNTCMNIITMSMFTITARKNIMSITSTATMKNITMKKNMKESSKLSTTITITHT